MSTITYKCNVCKREIEKLENKHGLTVFSKCIITEGCRGNLYKIYRDSSNIRESFPPIQEGVKDYFPRKLLYKHTQNVAAKEWRVVHNLSSSPTIIVYEKDNNGGYTILDQDEYTVSIVDGDKLNIAFKTSKKGEAHCISRTTVPQRPKLLRADEAPLQITSNGILTISVPEIITKSINPNKSVPFNTLDQIIKIEIQTIKPNEEPIICLEEFENEDYNAWIGWNRILIRKRRHYTIKSKALDDFRTFNGIELDLRNIPEGTILRFLRIDYGDGVLQTIPSRGLFILLSKYPYSSVDKIRNKLIDVGEMIKTEYDYFVFRNGELYTGLTNEEFTYPDISNAPGRTPITEIPVTPAITVPFPSASPVLSPTPTPTVTPTNTATVTPTPTVTSTIDLTPTVTPTVTPTNTVTVTPTMTQTVTPNPSVTPTNDATPTITPTNTATVTPTMTQTVTPNPTATPTRTPSVTPDPTITPTLTVTPTITPTQSTGIAVFSTDFSDDFA